MPRSDESLKGLPSWSRRAISGAVRAGETTSGPASSPGFSAGSGVLAEETTAAGVVVPLPASSLDEPPAAGGEHEREQDERRASASPASDHDVRVVEMRRRTREPGTALANSWIQYPPMPLAALDDQQQLTDRVLAALREAITSGRLPAGRAHQAGADRGRARRVAHARARGAAPARAGGPRPARAAARRARAGLHGRRRARAVRAARAARARRGRARDGARRRTRSAQTVQRLAGAHRAAARRLRGQPRLPPRALRAVRQRPRACARSTRSGRIARRTGSSPTRRGRPAPSSAWPPSTPTIARAFAAADAARVRALVHDHVRGAGEDALERSARARRRPQAEEIS